MPAMCSTHDAFAVRRPCIDAEGEVISRRGHRRPLLPQSSSSSRFTAGASEFFILPNAERHAATLTLTALTLEIACGSTPWYFRERYSPRLNRLRPSIQIRCAVRRARLLGDNPV